MDCQMSDSFYVELTEFSITQPSLCLSLKMLSSIMGVAYCLNTQTDVKDRVQISFFVRFKTTYILLSLEGLHMFTFLWGN